MAGFEMLRSERFYLQKLPINYFGKQTNNEPLTISSVD